MVLHAETKTQILEVIGVLDEPLIVAQAQYSEAIAQFLLILRGGGDVAAFRRCFVTCQVKCTQNPSQLVTQLVRFGRTS